MSLRTATSSTSDSMSKERYHLIDALRGFSIILMLGYHFGTALIYFSLAPSELIYNPFLQTLQPVFAGVFISVSGISGRFSRSNIRRGLILQAIAACLSVVTLFFGLNVWFGILHFLGLSMVLYGLFSRFLNIIPLIPGVIIYLGLFAFTFNSLPVLADNDWFCWLGFATEDFFKSTADYFPLLKWFPLFLLGTQLGQPIKEKKLPEWFYRFNMPVLPFVGRHTLIIYLAHQPVYYVLLTIYTTIRG